MNGYHVDLILRDIKRVEQIIKDTEQGIVTANYQTGHPHGYISAMYRGELAISKIVCRFHHLIIFLDSTNRLASSIKSSCVLCDLFFNQSSISDCRKANALFILCTGICLVDTHP